MKQEKIKLSVVLPAYNEAANIRLGSIEQVFDYLKNQSYSFEVLIIDDGSSDETLKLIESEIKNKKDFILLKNPHKGKAITVMSGLLASKGEIALFTDMDQATPLDQVEKFFPKFEDGFDVVIGSRHGRRGAPLIRKLAAFVFATIRNLILGLPFNDTQCGFKAFKRHAIDRLIPPLLLQWRDINTSGAAVNAGFDVVILFLAKKMNLKIAEQDVEYHHVGSERVQIIKDSFEAITDILRIKYNDISRKYDKLVAKK